MTPKEKKHRIEVGRLPQTHTIKDSPQLVLSLAPRKLSFGFTYFSETDHFGLRSSGRHIDNRWLLSLLAQLKKLGSYTIDEIRDPKTAHVLRHHKINWDNKNIPIKRADFEWIPQLRQSKEDYDLWQFQISQAMGRFFGFYDEHNTFQIIHIDPLHNAQPSEDFDYRVDECFALGTEYEYLLSDIYAMQSHCTGCCQANKHTEFSRILEEHKFYDSPTVVIQISNEQYEKYHNLQSRFQACLDGALSPSEVFLMGLNSADTLICESEHTE